jgi:excisionase family DNA binding protein
MQNYAQMVVQMTVVELQQIISNAVLLGIKKHHDSISNIEKTESDEILTREQVSNILNTSYPTLWKWNKSGVLKAHKIGNKVFYKKEDVMSKLDKKLH